MGTVPPENQYKPRAPSPDQTSRQPRRSPRTTYLPARPTRAPVTNRHTAVKNRAWPCWTKNSDREISSRNITNNTLDPRLSVASCGIKGARIHCQLAGDRKREGKICQLNVQKWNPNLQRVRHGACIDIAEQLIACIAVQAKDTCTVE